MAIEFSKYHGLGNDFILIDNRATAEPLITPEQAAKLCDRHFGIGADGVIFVLPPQGDTDYTMRIYNSDGSEPEMCGNGIRCLAKFIAELEGISGERLYRIHTLAGVISPQIQSDGQVRVDMGQPQLLAGEIPTTLATNDAKVVDVPMEVAGQSWASDVRVHGQSALYNLCRRCGGNCLRIDGSWVRASFGVSPTHQYGVYPSGSSRLPENAGVGTGCGNHSRLRNGGLCVSGGWGSHGTLPTESDGRIAGGTVGN